MNLIAALCIAASCGAAGFVLSARWVSADVGLLDERVARPGLLPRRVSRTQWLRQAGSELAPWQLWAASIGFGAATFGSLALVTRTPLVALAPAVAAAAIPRTVLAHRRAARVRSLQSAWPDGLRELLAAIGSGQSLTQGIRGLGDSGPEPLREHFADFAMAARVFGVSAALEHVGDRMADPTSDRVIEVLLVAHERGGAIVRAVLEDLVSATSKDVKTLDDIETEGLEMRINARAVLALPWLVLVALTLRPGPFRDFYGSGGGMLVVGVAGVLSILGAAWLARLGRLPDEPRVFGRSAPLPDPGRAR